MGEITKIPEEIRNNFTRKKVQRDQIVSYGKNGKIGYLISGEVQAVRYQEGERLVFPQLMEKGRFVGLAELLLTDDLEFEMETRRDSVILEIPVEFFNEYILSPAAEIRYLREINHNLLQGTRSFLIRAHGGAKAHLAYLFYISSEKKNIICFHRYTEIEEIIFSSRTMTYKILREFEDRGILRKETKSIIIEKRKMLREYFEKYIS